MCSRVCIVEMRVSSGGQTVKCNTSVTVNDTLPPVIVCPPDVIEVWTNGSIHPEMALVEAAKILRKHLNPFVHYSELGSRVNSASLISICPAATCRRTCTSPPRSARCAARSNGLLDAPTSPRAPIRSRLR